MNKYNKVMSIASQTKVCTLSNPEDVVKLRASGYTGDRGSSLSPSLTLSL